ncbi:DUF397 domain-containing protein [Streptomyces xiamenensis]
MATPQRIQHNGGAAWRRSSHSNQDGGNCLEVADGHPGIVPVRDSKRPVGPLLTFAFGPWAAFVAEVHAGQL